jgi:hypothetical protein
MFSCARRPGNFQIDVDPVATPPGVCESAFSGAARLPVVFERAAGLLVVSGCAADARLGNARRALLDRNVGRLSEIGGVRRIIRDDANGLIRTGLGVGRNLKRDHVNAD